MDKRIQVDISEDAHRRLRYEQFCSRRSYSEIVTELMMRLPESPAAERGVITDDVSANQAGADGSTPLSPLQITGQIGEKQCVVVHEVKDGSE